MYRAFPGSDYYEGSVTIGVSPRRPSRVSLALGKGTALECCPMTRCLLLLLLGGSFYLVVMVGCGGGLGVVTPTPTEAVSPSPTLEPSPVPTVEPSPIPTVRPRPSPTAVPSPTLMVEPSPRPTVVPSPTPTTISGVGEQENLRYDPDGPDRDCGDFETRAEAMAFFKAAGGPELDPHRLDRDRNGIPCESLPE